MKHITLYANLKFYFKNKWIKNNESQNIFNLRPPHNLMLKRGPHPGCLVRQGKD